MERGYFVSRSGLRPISAFVVLGAVLLGVAGKVTALAVQAAPSNPDPLRRETGAPLAFDIADRDGVVLAAFVDRYELHVSPRAMWQAHTPEYMAVRIAESLELDGLAQELLSSMLPDAPDGLVEVTAWELDADLAGRLEAWARDRGVERAVGFRASPDYPAAWRFVWNPALLLSREMRGRRSTWGWTRTLADGIAVALWGEIALEELGAREAELLARRDLVWEALLPSTWSLVLRQVPCERYVALRELLRAEGVQPHQMWLAPERERLHPAGESLLLGSWGWVDERAGAAVPRGGLERLCDRLLVDPAFAAVGGAPGSYSFRTDVAARRGSRPYFQDAISPTEGPLVRLTLDLELQRRTGELLAEALGQHAAALAMAIVLDLESGEVLALDSRERWHLGLFPPIHHQFTPGSTSKLLTMAVALEHALVTPEDRFDVGNRAWRVPNSSRVIREAEGQLRGVITATDCLAFSMNTGMAQIGLRIPAPLFHDTLDDLGYGRAPATGLGGEAAGWLPPLVRGDWSRAYTHASVSFGHELLTTLWQHAAGLSAMIRGGEWRPLRLVSGIESGAEVLRIQEPASLRVVSPGTAWSVRAMMAKGAREGTGKSVYRPDLGLLTKTGTAEKVPTERCYHVLGQALAAAAEEGRTLTEDELDALPLRGAHEKSCYTSSMCMVGHNPRGGPEVMVLVVVEEPTGQEKYGGRVAGPAAREILEAALGVGPEPGTERPVAALEPTLPRGLSERPWAEDWR